MGNSLLDTLGYPLRKKRIEHLISVPEVILCDSLETVDDVQREHYGGIVVHAPNASHLMEMRYLSTIGGWKQYRVARATSGSVSTGLEQLFNEGGADNSAASIKRLQEHMQEGVLARDRNMRHLEQAATELLTSDNETRPSQLAQLVRALMVSQFSHQEHLIREAVQNADGAAKNKADNRIDVYIDPVERLVRVEDLGRGMTQGVVDDVFFNMYRSLNEALEHAGGKFGVGAGSFFAGEHEYVRADTQPDIGVGGIVEVDSNLMREEGFHPTTRKKGTSIEIKFKPESTIDYDLLEKILVEDCQYIESPLFLHRDGVTRPLNASLTPPEAEGLSVIREQGILGHVRKISGEGKLHLLDHRIRLHSIPTKGYEGAIDCSGLETTLSRNTAIDDPVLADVLEIVGQRAARLQRKRTTESTTLGDRIREYDAFLRRTIYNDDGTPNTTWILQNFERISVPKTPTMFREKPNLITRIVSVPYTCIEALLDKDESKSFMEKYRERSQVTPHRKAFFTTGYLGVAAMGLDMVHKYVGGEFLPPISGALDTTGYYLLAGNAIGAVQQIFVHDIKSSLVNTYHKHIKESLIKRAPVSLGKRLKVSARNVALGLARNTALTLALSTVAIAGLQTYIGSRFDSSLRDRVHDSQASYFLDELFANTWIADIAEKIGSSSIHEGSRYRSRQSVIDQNKTTSKEGYVRQKISHWLEMSERGHMRWHLDKKNQQQPLRVTGLYKPLPEPLETLANAQGTRRFEEPRLSESERVRMRNDAVNAIHEYIDQHIDYDAVEPRVGTKYDDEMSAMLGERKATCDSATTFAAWALYRFGVREAHAAFGRRQGVGHAWMEVQEGTSNNPRWVIEDFTPTRLSAEYARALAEQSQRKEIPSSAIWLGVLALGGGLAYASQKRKYQPYTGPLSDEQQQHLTAVRERMQPRGADVHYGARLGEHEQAITVKGNAVILNRHRTNVPVYAVEVAFAASHKNAALARSIVDANKGGK